MGENSNIISEKVNMIKDLRSPEKEVTPKELDQDGILCELWKCIEKMRKHNNMLDESKKNLIRLIG